VAPAHSDERLLLHVDYVDDANVLQGHTLEHDEIFVWPAEVKNFDGPSVFLYEPLRIRKLVVDDGAVREHLAREAHLAQLALECLPAVRLHVGALLPASLGVEPLAQALQMDVAHGALAFAGRYQRILCFILFAKTNPAQSPLYVELGLLSQLHLQLVSSLFLLLLVFLNLCSKLLLILFNTSSILIFKEIDFRCSQVNIETVLMTANSEVLINIRNSIARCLTRYIRIHYNMAWPRRKKRAASSSHDYFRVLFDIAIADSLLPWHR
jgi:hypothetical protein